MFFWVSIWPVILHPSYAGIRLYSYVDEKGQTIIVGSPDKIPEKFRNQVKEGYIPTFRSRKKSDKKVTIIESVPDKDREEAKPDRHEDQVKPVIVEPPAEDYTAEIASATAYMEEIRKIQFNNERIHVLSLVSDPKGPVILQLHQQNVLAIENLASLANFEWDAGKAWKKQALELTRDMKTIQYTITKWILEGGAGLKEGLPPLLHGSRIRVDKLENTLKELIEQVKGKK